MRWIVHQFARLVGTTFEDWLLAALMVTAVALTVIGVRGCTDDHAREIRSQAVHAR